MAKEVLGAVLGSCKMAISAKMPLIKGAVHSHLQLLQPGTEVARIMKKEFVVGHKGKIDRRRAIRGFDNSSTSNRYNGGGKAGSKPGLYLATQARNRLFPTITCEAAYYNDPSSFLDLASGQSPLEKQREYFQPINLMPPSKFVLIYHTTKPLLFWESGTGHEDLSRVLRDELSELTDELRKHSKQLSPARQLELFGSAASQELTGGTTLSIRAVLNMPNYLLSQPVGNSCLEENWSVMFPSARAPFVSTQYMDGGSNFLLPMLADQPVGLDLASVCTFEATTKRLKKISIEEYNEQADGSGAHT